MRMVKSAIAGAALAATAIMSGTASAEINQKQLNIQAGCTNMGELARGLDQVVNEMQIYNNSRDIWRTSSGCRFRSLRDAIPETYVFLGWYRTTPTQRNAPVFWVPVFGIEFTPTRRPQQLIPGVTIREDNRFFRPDGVFRADTYRLPRGCESQWIERPAPYKPIRLYGADRNGLLDYCRTIDRVGRGFRESH